MGQDENLNGLDTAIHVLNDLVNLLLDAGGDSANSIQDREKCYDWARKIKPQVDKLFKARFKSDTAKFDQLIENYKTLNQDLKDKLAHLISVVNTLETITRILDVADKGLEVAAGLAKSM